LASKIETFDHFKGGYLLIKVNQSELGVYENSDIYIGLPGKGQLLRKWGELNENVKSELENIRSKAENLIRRTEQLLSEQQKQTLGK
jgi:hypothetical protein